MTKQFDYGDAATSRHGLMICGACREPITQGQYRYRELPDRFVTHHRDCSLDDPRWASLDRRAEAEVRRIDELRAEARAFYEKWGVTDLSDWLEQVPS
jgi:hypothetical protein